jgi:predicted RNA-binding protein YlxR (DUF448 family)
MTLSEHKTKKGSERTCAGCGRADAREALLRLVLAGACQGEPAPSRRQSEPGVVVDAAGGAFGRGAHLHPTFGCLEKACKAGFARAFKQKVHADPDELARQIHEAYDRRIVGLVLGARRAGHLAIGQEAALGARAPLLVVACDAGSVAGRAEVERAVAEGRAVVWKDKSALGALFGATSGEGVAVFAVMHGKIAVEIRQARSRSEACSRRREVR